jgi:hypothetical protein
MNDGQGWVPFVTVSGELFPNLDVRSLQEAIIVGLITLISENNRHLISGDNPLYLLLKLILIDWSDDSCIINQISSNIWDYKKQYGW